MNSDIHAHIKGSEDLLGNISAPLLKIKQLAAENRNLGVIFTLLGSPGSGKHAFVSTLCKEMRHEVPFVFYNPAENIHAQFRRAVKVCITESTEIHEGEIISKSTGENIELTLKTTKNTKQIVLEKSFNEELKKQEIGEGDIIFIQSGTGIIKRLGRSENFSHEHDLEKDMYIPLPEGEVTKIRVDKKEVTLHDLDSANSKIETGKKKEGNIFDYYVRNEVNEILEGYIENEIASISRGFFIVENVGELENRDLVFKEIRSLLKHEAWSPLVILIQNLEESKSTKDPKKPLKYLEETIIIETVPPNTKELITRILESKNINPSLFDLIDKLKICDKEKIALATKAKNNDEDGFKKFLNCFINE